MANMEIKERDGFKVVGMKKYTNLKRCKDELPELWQEFSTRFEEIKNRINENMLGLGPACSDDCDADFEYVAGVEVSDVSDVPEGMVSVNIPRQKYAVYIHKGQITKISETYDQIYSKYLAEDNVELKKESISFELYDDRYKDGGQDSEFEIWMPVN